MSARQLVRQPWFADALAIAVLGVIAWTIAGSLVRDDVFIYGDLPDITGRCGTRSTSPCRNTSASLIGFHIGTLAIPNDSSIRRAR